MAATQQTRAACDLRPPWKMKAFPHSTGCREMEILVLVHLNLRRLE